ncbi:hypothetical protein SUGI_1122400 [Cryptomeria japonica]|nr:hypothetical protein SUGI_1122400 [Cryptomeria japonica]
MPVLSPSEGYNDQVLAPQILTQIAVKTSIGQAQTIRGFIPPVYERLPMDEKQSQAMDDSMELYDLTVGSLMDGLSILTESSLGWNEAVDIQSYLSATLTNIITYLNGLQEAKVNFHFYSFTDHMSNASWGVSNFLALKTKSGVKLAANAMTVAQDGSCDFMTISDAINAVPNNNLDRSVIYVTAGVYEEYVSVPSNKFNSMLIGDGKDVTVITGNRSVGDNSTTFNSATLDVLGCSLHLFSFATLQIIFSLSSPHLYIIAYELQMKC